MKYLICLFLGCLFTVSCTCDGEVYCGEEIYSNYITFSGFNRGERDNLVLKLQSIDSNEVVANLDIGRDIYDKTYYFDLPFSHSYDLRTHYYVIESGSFTDTIGDFSFELENTTLNCSGGCNGNYSTTQDFTVYQDYYFIYQGDTIRNEEPFTIQH